MHVSLAMMPNVGNVMRQHCLEIKGVKDKAEDPHAEIDQRHYVVPPFRGVLALRRGVLVVYEEVDVRNLLAIGER